MHSRGRLILFADADGATRFADLGLLLAAMEKTVDGEGMGMVVGSRAHLVTSDAVVKVSPPNSTIPTPSLCSETVTDEGVAQQGPKYAHARIPHLHSHPRRPRHPRYPMWIQGWTFSLLSLTHRKAHHPPAAFHSSHGPPPLPVTPPSSLVVRRRAPPHRIAHQTTYTSPGSRGGMARSQWEQDPSRLGFDRYGEGPVGVAW